jgi:hypothetical protein
MATVRRTCVFCQQPIARGEHAVGMNEASVRRISGQEPHRFAAQAGATRWFAHRGCANRTHGSRERSPLPPVSGRRVTEVVEVVPEAARPVGNPVHDALWRVIDVLDRAVTGDTSRPATDYAIGFAAAVADIRTTLAIAARQALEDSSVDRITVWRLADRLVADGRDGDATGFRAGYCAAHLSAARLLEKTAMNLP